jgi:hypothetical protein
MLLPLSDDLMRPHHGSSPPSRPRLDLLLPDPSAVPTGHGQRYAGIKNPTLRKFARDVNGATGVPAVPRVGDQVPGRTELQGTYAHMVTFTIELELFFDAKAARSW